MSSVTTTHLVDGADSRRRMAVATILFAAVVLTGGQAASGATNAGSADNALLLVGLGDSIPGGLGCSSPCRSYVEVLGDRAAVALGQDVTVINLATNDSLTSGGLLNRVATDDQHRQAIAAADIVTVQIGFNDWQGPCVWNGAAICLDRGSAIVKINLHDILSEIERLRAGAPTVVRVITYYNGIVGDPAARGYWQLDPAVADADFEAFFGRQLDLFDAMLCRVAELHRATCVELRVAFNGPSQEADAGLLLQDDHLHPSQTGHEAIATAIDAIGYAISW